MTPEEADYVVKLSAEVEDLRGRVERAERERDEARAAYDVGVLQVAARAERAEAALRDGCCPHCGFWVLNPALAPNPTDNISQRMLDNPAPGENEAAEQNLDRFLAPNDQLLALGEAHGHGHNPETGECLA